MHTEKKSRRDCGSISLLEQNGFEFISRDFKRAVQALYQAAFLRCREHR
jgi:hypothetical protein